MATLEKSQKLSLKKKILSSPSKWIFIGIDANQSLGSEKLQSVVGIVDWILHGQVSELIHRNALDRNELCLLPDAFKNKPNFLLFHYKEPFDEKALRKKISGLHLQELIIAESTFPQDFLKKLKENLKKEEVAVTILEST